MGLFDPALLVYTIPAFLALAFWLLGLAGLFDYVALDADLDGADAGLFAFAGLGLVPLSVIASLLLFFFGWTGIGLHLTVGDMLDETGWREGTQSMLFFIPALLIAFFASAGTTRLVRPLFEDYGQAGSAPELIGRVAVVNSGSVSSTFGSAEVRPSGGVPIEIAVRTDGEAAARYGDRVLITDYDSAHGTYTVEPFDPHSQPSTDDLDMLASR